jgi:metallo-beta-lactamase family protein
MHKRKRHHSRNQSGVTVFEREARIDLAKRPADGLGVAFLGASGTVTGSRYLVDDGETQIVVDPACFRDPGICAALIGRQFHPKSRMSARSC